MKTVFVTRREQFNAAHRLYRPELSDEENFRLFGPCSNPNWHGHNYVLFVTVKGVVDSYSGMVLNLKELSRIIKTYVIDILDHKNLNIEVPFLQGILPTTENLAIAIWDVLQQQLEQFHNVQLFCVKIQETENNFVEYYGPEK